MKYFLEKLCGEPCGAQFFFTLLVFLKIQHFRDIKARISVENLSILFISSVEQQENLGNSKNFTVTQNLSIAYIELETIFDLFSVWYIANKPRLKELCKNCSTSENLFTC